MSELPNEQIETGIQVLEEHLKSAEEMLISQKKWTEQAIRNLASQQQVNDKSQARVNALKASLEILKREAGQV